MQAASERGAKGEGGREGRPRDVRWAHDRLAGGRRRAPRDLPFRTPDAFYASVEQAERPELRGVPLVVGGHEELRHGIVLAKSAGAKAAGVKTGEALWEARAKCPGLVVVPPRYEVYQAYSAMARRIYYQYTDLVEPFGLDEAWLDLTGSLGLAGGDAAQAAAEISGRGEDEAGLTVSIGVSGTRYSRSSAATTAGRRRHVRSPRTTAAWCGRPGERASVRRSRHAPKLHSSGIDRISDYAPRPSCCVAVWAKIDLVLRTFARNEDATPVKPYDAARKRGGPHGEELQ